MVRIGLARWIENVKAGFSAVTNALRVVFQWVNDNILGPFISGIRGAWQWVNDNILHPFKESIGAIFKGLAQAFEGVKSIFNALTNALDNFSFSCGGDGGTTGKIARQLGFAEGGKVLEMADYRRTLYAASGTFVPRGTDTVPAMLTPGEFVVNRDATRNNIGLLNLMNNGRSPVAPGGQGPTNISIVINAKTELSPDQIRREVMPTLEKELKKKSLAGKFVIAKEGTRSRR